MNRKLVYPKFVAVIFTVLSVSLGVFCVPDGFSGELTDLSITASKLKIGMSRKEVISFLGTPTWAVIQSDRGNFSLMAPIIIELYWKNTPCTPVAVDFDSTDTVTGWDEGRALCGKDAYMLEPSGDYSCGKADRNKFCK
jgi:hypothetical protein